MTQTRNRDRPCLRNHVGDMYTCLLQLLWTCWFWDLKADSRHPKDGFESRGRSSYKLISDCVSGRNLILLEKWEKTALVLLPFLVLMQGSMSCVYREIPRRTGDSCVSHNTNFSEEIFWDFRGNMDTQIETCFGLCPVYLLLMDLGNEFSHCNNRGKLSVPLS